MKEKIRLQKFLSQKGLFSRREVENMIRQKRLTINGKLATLGDRVIQGDQIFLDGVYLDIPKKIKRVVIAFFKPSGVECTWEKNSEEKTLADFDFRQLVFNIGRLDKDSHGLLLLTNDGELANQLMHPKYKKEKEYLVVTNKDFDESFIKKLSEGIEISPKKITQKCFVEKVESKIFHIILKEGKNRQIRRMCEKLNYRVMDLLRIRMGKIYLGDLKEGKFRFLSEIEVKSLQKY